MSDDYEADPKQKADQHNPEKFASPESGRIRIGGRHVGLNLRRLHYGSVRGRKTLALTTIVLGATE
jgi:hypothetical protein